MKNGIFIILIAMAQLTTSCKNEKAATAAVATASTTPVAKVGQHAVIYKTKADYTNYVPISLSDDKSKITSYPAPTDVYYKGKLATPTALAQGYLLDNRGVNKNTAFIKLTYNEYSKLLGVLPLTELYKLIIDKAPFTEMYDLGLRSSFSNEQKDIDTIINANKLKDYRKML